MSPPSGLGGRAGAGGVEALWEVSASATSCLLCSRRYRVVVEGERGNRPHIYCLEQLLQEAVRGGGRGLRTLGLGWVSKAMATTVSTPCTHPMPS